MRRSPRISTIAACSFLLAWILPSPAPAAGCPVNFRRGDTNADGKVDLSDAVATLGHLFLGSAVPGCLDAADADDSGELEITDAVRTLLYLFGGGEALPAPGVLVCGPDPTPDDLGCISDGPCPVTDPRGEVCDGIDNDCDGNIDCLPGFFCQTALDDCGGIAACVEIPGACPDNVDPVCGCNGKTYGNGCEAAAAQVSVAHAGRCVQGGECASNDDCAAAEYCEKAAADCRGAGSCATRPQGCPAVFRPVCGCDGTTYGSACDAAAAGVNVWKEGECDLGACTDNDGCPGDFYCARAAGDCNGEGTCAIRSRVCPALFKPVCGCDGVTYGNSCEAAGAGVNVLHSGKCAATICESNEECDLGFYCARQEGDCVGSGSCTEVPASCPDGSDPVCGCDGITYKSGCAAAQAGASVRLPGECLPP